MAPASSSSIVVAIWAAAVSSTAAIIAFSAMLIQRRSLRESGRPEIVLAGWTRGQRMSGAHIYDALVFKTIRNVGRGAALHIYMNAFERVEKEDGVYPVAIMSTTRIPILAPGESEELNGEIELIWKNVPESGDHKRLPITISIYYWDAHGLRHETTYSMYAVELKPNVGVVGAIAPGVGLTTRNTTSIPVWRLKAGQWKARKIEKLTSLIRLQRPWPW